jgi:hypothetical protein
MSYHYTKIDDITFNDVELYFRTPLTTVFTHATIFSDKYLYFHSPSSSKTDPNIKSLGKFVKLSRMSSGCPYADYDYSVYEFELGNVNCKQDGRTDGHIYLIGIPDSNDNMYPVDCMVYKGWPVFSLKKKE